MVEPEELLRTWPDWQKTSADKVLASPAWRMPVAFARQKDTLTVAAPEDFPGGEIYLTVKLDETEHVLGIGDSEHFPDLHLLWAMRAKLDPNILLALVEKECGALFVLIEQVFGRDFQVVALAEAATGTRTAFKTSQLRFSIDLTAELRLPLGDIRYLDPRHDVIRTMTRPARADFGGFALDEAAVAALAPGDVIPLGVDYLASAGWALETFSDGLIHVVGAEEKALRFADFADETLPAVEAADALVLMTGARILAEGELIRLGELPCFKLTHMRS